MKVTTFCKVGVSLGAAALLIGGVAVPAMADPVSGSFGTLVGLGSDTTQDVVNGLASAIGGNQVASYNANSGSPTIITRDGGIAIPRVSGSGAGRDTLRVAIGQLANKSGVAVSDGTTAQIDSSVVGQLDFARSSGGPATADQSASGVLTYVPFARDAVDVAYAPGSPLANVPLFLGNANDPKTAPSLYNIYKGDVAYVFFNSDGSYNSAGKTADLAPAGTTSYKLQPLLPKYGSGTRSYFTGQVGLTDASGLTTTNPYIKDVSAGSPIEEHDGTAVIAETNSTTLAIAPFSISQWVTQANKPSSDVKDRRHGVVLASLSGTATGQVPATTGSGTSYATNAAYTAMVRDVYNIVPSRLVDDPSSAIAKTFAGPKSLVCSLGNVISAYGFLPEPATSSATTCGYTGLRAFDASPSTTAVQVPATGVSGSTVTATATVGSFGNGGGSVNFSVGGSLVKTAVIARGATSVSAALPLSATGSQVVTAQFVPALGGVASSISPVANVTVSAAVSISKTTLSVPAEAFGKATTITANIASGDAHGGSVSFFNGKTLLGKSAVKAGATKATFAFVPRALAYSIKAVYTPSTGAAQGSTSAVVTVKVAAGTPSVKVAKPGTVKSTVGGKVSVTVTGTVSVPAGTVVIKEGSKVLAKKALAGGKATITLPKLKVGSHKLTVTYTGSSTWKAVTVSGVVLKVVK